MKKNLFFLLVILGFAFLLSQGCAKVRIAHLTFTNTGQWEAVVIVDTEQFDLAIGNDHTVELSWTGSNSRHVDYSFYAKDTGNIKDRQDRDRQKIGILGGEHKYIEVEVEPVSQGEE